MKKIYLSVPIEGLNDAEVQANIDFFKQYLTEEDEAIDNFITIPEGSLKLYGLGEGIKKIGECDEVWMHPNWRYYRECYVEYTAAYMYDISILDFSNEMTYGCVEERKRKVDAVKDES